MKDTNVYHTPVLIEKVIEGLNVQEGKKYIDATLGGGGHAGEIVKRGGSVLGIDVDKEAILNTKKRYRDREIMGLTDNHRRFVSIQVSPSPSFLLVLGNFRDIKRIAGENGFSAVDGILFDLGVSSYQLDTSKRGFSYRWTGVPIDLRMNQKKGTPAWEIVSAASEEELYEILAKFGEEKRARAIAHDIVRARSVKPIVTGEDLIDIVIRNVSHGKELYPMLSRVWQALRIKVNDELDALREGLAGAENLLVAGGRLVVVSYHSLEDRIVKQFMQRNHWKAVTKKPIVPTHEEIRLNPRARSGKLRIAVKSV